MPETKLVWRKDSRGESFRVVINAADFNPAIDSETEPDAVGPVAVDDGFTVPQPFVVPEVPAVEGGLSEKSVVAARAIILAAASVEELDQLEAEEIQNGSYEGGRKTVLSAISARRRELNG